MSIDVASQTQGLRQGNMKYGLLFAVLSMTIVVAYVATGRHAVIYLWPATSFAILSLGYLGLGSGVFGKRPDGTLRWVNVTILLPYLLMLWGTWHLVRYFRSNAPYHELTEGVLIGRRMLAHEFPSGIQSVFDLTCEFFEPSAIRKLAYHSCPVLDGSAPPVGRLLEWSQQVLNARRPVFIHCAEGHGRTGLLAAIVLIRAGKAASATEAVSLIRSKRSGVNLQTVQMQCLEIAAKRILSNQEPTHEITT